MKEIKIKLPGYISNIFEYSSLNGENDYIKNVFDDRNINLDSFYNLNFEIYKILVIQKKYNDKDFLVVKKNLYTIFQLYRSKYIRINFTFSNYYDKKDFIEKELSAAGSEFDKFYGNLYGKRNYGFIKNFLKSKANKGVFFYELQKKFIEKDGYDIFYKLDFIDDLKEELNNGYDQFDGIILKLDGKEFEKHIQFLIDLFSEEEIKKILQINNRDNPIYYNYELNILPTILGNDYGIEWYDSVGNELKELIKSTIKGDILNYLGFILHKGTKIKLNFFDELNIGNEIRNYLGGEKNKKEEINLEIIEDLFKIIKIDGGKKFIFKLFNNDTELLKSKIIFFIDNYSYSELYDLYKELFGENYFLKLNYDKDIASFLLHKDGIEILKNNNKNDNVIGILKYIPDLLLNLIETEDGVGYLRELEIKSLVFILVMENKTEDWVPRFFDNLLDKTEGIKYFNELIQEGNFVKDIIDILLKMTYFNFSKISKYDISLKAEIIKLLIEEEGESFKKIFQNIKHSDFGRECIVDADIQEKILKESLKDGFFTGYYDFPINYLKALLLFETNQTKNQVYDFIKKSNSGSCLLSGYRGTGKTSLLNTIIQKIQKENDTEIIQVMINIPEQKKDENGEKKVFNKNELITKIIREIYLAFIKNGYSKSEIKNFEEQYIRTFKNIEDFEGILQLKKRGFLRLAIDVLSFSLPIFSGLILNYILGLLKIKIFGQTFGFSFEMIQLFIAFILIVLNFLFFRTIFNASFKARMERTLYNDEIAEYKLTENIKKFHNKNSFFHKFKEVFSLNQYKKIFLQFINFLKGLLVSKKRKLVIVIDELDKLLDLDKGIGKGNMDMVDIFDLLGKLKTLFFDNTGAIFFVVTNKDAYNYYLENKHSEDDLVSNIFNKVLYLPMISKENFNLNWSFEIEGGKNKIKESIIYSKEKEDHQHISKWLYFKSHGNWRKANFILSQELRGNKIILSKEKIDFDMNFYNFVDLLYNLFESEDNKNSKEKFDEYFTPGKLFYNFINDKVINNKLSYCDDICSKLITSIGDLGINFKDVIGKNKELLKKYTSEKVPFNIYAYIHASVERISGEFAYRDYILNNILNILEILKHDKVIRLEDIILKLKFNEYDIKYPVFEDLILIYIPFMIYYFDKLEKGQK